MLRQEGEEAENMVGQLVRECLDVVGRGDEDPAEVRLKLRTNYWIILATKPK